MAVLGVAERGTPSDGPMDRTTGVGWVRATTDHDYADALARGNPVTLLVSETTGALSPTFLRLLLALAKQARAPTTHDSTRYGAARTSPRSFLTHHLTAISAAIVTADAVSIAHAAAAMSWKLSMGLAP